MLGNHQKSFSNISSNKLVVWWIFQIFFFFFSSQEWDGNRERLPSLLIHTVRLLMKPIIESRKRCLCCDAGRRAGIDLPMSTGHQLKEYSALRMQWHSFGFFLPAVIDFHLSLRLRAPGQKDLHQYSQRDNEGLGQGHVHLALMVNMYVCERR